MTRLDLVIFGATGFTGKHAVVEMARMSSKYQLSWAIAGRSQSKLEDVLRDARRIIGEEISCAKIIIADVKDAQSLRDMCSQARVVVSCCGPYRFYGEPVVRAAIDAQTHYVDVSGEPQFIETMQLKYDAQAREAGVFVISACGFDSIPNDLGVVFLEQNFEGTLNSVESYLSASGPKGSGAINYGTWESLIYGITYLGELPELRKKIYPEPMPECEPKLKRRWCLHRRLGGWCVPFPGADASVLHRSQRARRGADPRHRPLRVRTYVRLPALLHALALLLAALILYVMTRSRCTRWLLLKYPRLFSLGYITAEGPSEEVICNTTFSFHLLGEGWGPGTSLDAAPDKQLAVRVSGVNPGYGATVVALLLSAVTILSERDRMPPLGGVVTAGFAFRNTNIIKHLQEHNLKFEIVSVDF
ncbi:saccharopine dehydrogenase-like oxidoreductase [Zerene cesonia]|uniref:saccharopine dehydrogenase-like oxidoreductase n=1 Tax=Zerene cesonia TaxID=33412 RepID=UPI0018E521FF|nr:saccharopine dehydrogenase-like oxidoreductase [Zerene cesonia]